MSGVYKAYRFEDNTSHQFAERVRELETEVVQDVCLSQIPPAYSSHPTPRSNITASIISNHLRPQNFPISLVSPDSFVPTQQFGLSRKILERAHEIPKRFWIEWKHKQMQHRIGELEIIKTKSTSPNEDGLATANRRKSLLLSHDAQHHVSLPESISLNEISSSSTNDCSSFSFGLRSIDSTDTANINDSNTPSPIEPLIPVPSIRKSQSTLDRSDLSIFLPFFHTNILPQQAMSTDNHCQSFDERLLQKPSATKDHPVQTMSSASSIEDVANIDTELHFTILLRDNQTSPLLYSKAIINRTIEFRSLSSIKDPLISPNQTSTKNTL